MIKENKFQIGEMVVFDYWAPDYLGRLGIVIEQRAPQIDSYLVWSIQAEKFIYCPSIIATIGKLKNKDLNDR